MYQNLNYYAISSQINKTSLFTYFWSIWFDFDVVSEETTTLKFAYASLHRLKVLLQFKKYRKFVSLGTKNTKLNKIIYNLTNSSFSFVFCFRCDDDLEWRFWRFYNHFLKVIKWNVLSFFEITLNCKQSGRKSQVKWSKVFKISLFQGKNKSIFFSICSFDLMTSNYSNERLI